jgi:RNA polymerase sigma-70 factor, ECF subfamily
MDGAQSTADKPFPIRLASLARLRQSEHREWFAGHTPAQTNPNCPTHMADNADMTSTADFEDLVGRYYRLLYQFAFSLTHNETEACDLTQQTFYVWAVKGHQLRDATKVKTWLFTTLYREFLKGRRRQTRFPHLELEQMDHELPTISPTMVDQLDADTVVEALGRVDELYRAPLALFYLEEHTYKEIAEILDVPIGTVQSRISRGKAQLQHALMNEPAPENTKERRPRG